MSLRTKAVLSIFCVLAVVIASLYITSRLILINGLSRIEKFEAQQASQRTLSALSQSLLQLDNDAADWAQWDDTYAFITDNNSQYVRSNLVDSSFVHLGVNVMLFINSSGKVVFARAFDTDNNQEMPVPPQLVDDA